MHCFCVYAAGDQTRASHMLGKHSTTELYPSQCVTWEAQAGWVTVVS